MISKMLSEITSVITKGTTPTSVGCSFSKNGINYIKSESITSSRTLDKSKYAFISEETHQKLKRSQIKENDILFSMAGMFLGKTGIVQADDVPANTNQAVAIIRIVPEQANYLYVYYYLNQKNIVTWINSLSGQSAQPNINLKQIGEIEIPLPDRIIQDTIVEMLSAIDSRIELNTAINENLELQAQAYFVDLFITNADPNWRIGTISDLGNVVGGGTPSKKVEEYYTSDGIAWITPKDLSNDKSKFVAHGETDITELGLAKSSATLMPNGTVLFSSRAPIGYIAIADGQVCTNQGFKSIVPFDNVGTAFVYYFLKENLSAIENVASGSTFKEVSGSTMKNFTAIIPDNDALAEFQRFCSPLFEQQRALEYENRHLSSIRDTLLPKLMNGEIDVSAVQI